MFNIATFCFCFGSFRFRVSVWDIGLESFWDSRAGTAMVNLTKPDSHCQV